MARPTPSATPTTAARSPRPPRQYVSKTYGYRIELPADWIQTDGGTQWDPTTTHFSLSTLGMDKYTHYDLRIFEIGAAQVARGTSLADWQTTLKDASPAACVDDASSTKTKLAGARAITWTGTCSDGYFFQKLAALHAGSGYLVMLVSPILAHRDADSSLFEAVRKSFTFE